MTFSVIRNRRGAARLAAGWGRAGTAPVAAALLLALAAAGPGCVVEPEAVSCATGVYCPAGAKCAARQAVCIVTDCGDGALQGGEICDDGNVTSGDGCSATCKSAEVCGNGIVDFAAGEVCEPPDRCSPDCRSTLACGNGKFDPGEDCDPGVVPTAICNVDCSVSRHGDGILNALDVVEGTSHGELCDGGVVDGDSPSCQSVEGCAADCCTDECTPSAHGDGIVNSSHLVAGTLHGEECDGGVKDQVPPSPSCESAGCDADCTFASCGDGTPNALHVAEGTSHVEQCDDGNGQDDDECVAGCASAVCGDGFVNERGPTYQLGRPEACDHGARVAGGTDPALRNGDLHCPYGPRTCAGCSTACEAMPATAHYCGDHQVDVARPDATGQLHTEACDSAFSFACRKCSDVTCEVLPDAAAEGTITVPDGSQLVEGDTLTFADGLGGVATVRFHRVTDARAGPSCTANACVIEFRDGTSANNLAIDLEAVVGLWAIDVGLRSRSGNVVAVQNARAGIAGNVPVQKSPAAARLGVSGMGGGIGCPLDRSYDCTRDTDCVGGAQGSCAGNKCVTP